MNYTFERAIYDVRRLLNDRTRDVIVPEVMIEDALNAALSELQTSDGVAFRRETPAFANLVAGVTSYAVTLPAGVDSVGAIDDLTETVNNWPLKPESLEWFRAVNTGPGKSLGPPIYYHLYVDETAATRLLIHGEPDKAYTLRATWRATLAKFEWSSHETLVLTAKTVEALTKRAAGNVLAILSDAKLEQLGLSRQAASMYMNQSKIAALHVLREVNGNSLQDTIVRSRG